MPEFSESDERRFQSYLNVHLKKDQQSLSSAEQMEALKKRSRSKWWHLLINVAALLFFGYSFFYGITRLSQTVFIFIFAVFGINMGLIIYQKKQLRELIDYLRWKQRHE